MTRHRALWRAIPGLGAHRALVLLTIEDLAQHGRPSSTGPAAKIDEENPIAPDEVAGITGLALTGAENALRELSKAGLVRKVWVLGFDEENPDRPPRSLARFLPADAYPGEDVEEESQ